MNRNIDEVDMLPSLCKTIDITPECLSNLYLYGFFNYKRNRNVLTHFMYLINTNPTYKTLSVYEGMGHWIYIHKTLDMTLFQVYVAESGQLEDILKMIVERYIIPLPIPIPIIIRIFF